MGVNIDDLFSNPFPVQENDTGIKDLVSTPKKTEVKAKNETSSIKILDKYKVLIFAIDHSGSMADALSSDNPEDYDWPEDLKAHMLRALSFQFGRTEEDDALQALVENSEEAEIKKIVLEQNSAKYNIYPKRNRSSKMELVKQSVKDLVDRRYEKYPDARVALMPFDTDARVEAASLDEIKIALDRLCPGGGTSITYAVSTAMAYFEKYPSPVGLHHLVLVSDGADWGAMAIEADLLPKMKELGVVLDFIYIASTRDVTASSVALMFSRVCKELGGEYVEVTSAEAFKKKLLNASERLCLPPVLQE